MTIKLRLHAFKMGASEDPYLMAAFPLTEWEQTEKGRWVIENTVDQPVFYCVPNLNMGYDIMVDAVFSEQSAVEYALKFDINKQLVS
jgi:hypothetical protein